MYYISTLRDLFITWCILVLSTFSDSLFTISLFIEMSPHIHDIDLSEEDDIVTTEPQRGEKEKNTPCDQNKDEQSPLSEVIELIDNVENVECNNMEVDNGYEGDDEVEFFLAEKKRKSDNYLSNNHEKRPYFYVTTEPQRGEKEKNTPCDQNKDCNILSIIHHEEIIPQEDETQSNVSTEPWGSNEEFRNEIEEIRQLWDDSDESNDDDSHDRSTEPWSFNGESADVADVNYIFND